ncbi:TetR/AcrR family transcriptional regulator [Caballeronia grimmiae]|uniref:HTH tetR-type domain-containing protein n=1 Tax=Caballeronia grimmiae TaxID=1071679 RepID=A0A069P3C8_9BURK|nr:TetR/AcrR family transcriptional regulator [Caballeronia grimmiae]KDR34409.1 hypothetical protein BG57_06660 [Caballeronia grimmiae]GGD51078.1 hypothetical protein GCM10010985_00960 [Caballeronia grimmiae]
MNDVRERILGTAARLFSQHSCHQIGVDLIARESNVSKVTMYRYFQSKEALLLEVLKERMQAIEEALTCAIACNPSGRERLRAIFRWYESWFNQPDFQGCVFVAALYEYHAHPQVVSMAEAQRERLRELIRRTLLDMIHPSVLDQLSRQMVFLLYGAIFFAQTGRKGAAAQDAWECASQLIDFAIQGRA